MKTSLNSLDGNEHFFIFFNNICVGLLVCHYLHFLHHLWPLFGGYNIWWCDGRAIVVTFIWFGRFYHCLKFKKTYLAIIVFVCKSKHFFNIFFTNLKKDEFCDDIEGMYQEFTCSGKLVIMWWKFFLSMKWSWSLYFFALNFSGNFSVPHKI